MFTTYKWLSENRLVLMFFQRKVFIIKCFFKGNYNFASHVRDCDVW